MPLRERLLGAVLFVSLILGGLAGLDHAAAPTELDDFASPSGALPHPLHPGARPTLVVFIDSLPAALSRNAEAMPHLAALASASTYAQVQTCRTAFTMPAVRALFTGRDWLAVFSFIGDFLQHPEYRPSFFTALNHSGVRSAAWSDVTFNQFGDDLDRFPIEDPDSNVDELQQQLAAGHRALEAFRSGKYPFVLIHFTVSDHRAHAYPSDSEPYREVFHALDDFVAEADRSLPAEQTLVVLGDHGHDANGVHSIFNRPDTAFVVRGAAFAPHLDLGRISITDELPFFAWALEVPLPPSYSGRRHPEALVPSGPIPDSFRGGTSQLDQRIPPAHWPAVFALMLHVALLGRLGMRLMGQRTPLLGLVVAALPLAFPGLLSSLLGCALALGLLIFLDGRAQRSTLITVAVSAAAFLWGWLWSQTPLVHVSTSALVYLLASGGLALTLVPVARRWGAARAGGVALALEQAALSSNSLFVGGSAVGVGVAWPVWAGFGLFRGGLSRPGLSRWLVLTALWALVLTLPQVVFLNASAREHWDMGLPAGLALSLVLAAKLGVWVRRSNVVPGLLFTFFSLALQLGVLPSGRWEQVTALAVMACGFALWGRGGAWGRVAMGGGLWLVLHATIAQPPGVWAWADVLTVSLLAAARWIRDPAPDDEAAHHELALILSAGTMAGWVVLIWSLMTLDWFFLFDWIPPEHAERYAFSLMPVIALRYPLGLAYLRWHLAETRAASRPDPIASQTLVLTGRAVLGLFFLAGIGLQSTFGKAYQRGIEEAVIWSLLALGAFLPLPPYPTAASPSVPGTPAIPAPTAAS